MCSVYDRLAGALPGKIKINERDHSSHATVRKGKGGKWPLIGGLPGGREGRGYS